MKNTTLILATIAIATGAFISLYVKHRQVVTSQEKGIEMLTNNCEMQKHRADEYYSMILNNLYSESSFLCDTILLTKLETLQQVPLCSLIQNGPILVLRFSQYSCDVCVKRELSKLHEMNEYFDSNKFIIIASFDNIRFANLYKLDYDIKYPFYLVDEKVFDVPLEELLLPYFMLIEEDYRVSKVFYPLISTPELTDSYYQILKEKYSFLFTENN